MMNHYLKNKISLIYKSKSTALVLIINLIFLILNGYANVSENHSLYFNSLGSDWLFWLIIIPSTMWIHKQTIFNSNFNLISRLNSRKIILILDYLIITISTFVINLILLIVPVIYFRLFLIDNLNEINLLKLCNFILRYNLIAILVQFITYLIYFKITNFQKYSNSIIMIPLILYIILTGSYELLELKDIAALDFGAGRYFKYMINNKIEWSSIFFSNLHLIVYLIFIFYLSISFFAKRMEYADNENNSA